MCVHMCATMENNCAAFSLRFRSKSSSGNGGITSKLSTSKNLLCSIVTSHERRRSSVKQMPSSTSNCVHLFQFHFVGHRPIEFTHTSAPAHTHTHIRRHMPSKRCHRAARRVSLPAKLIFPLPLSAAIIFHHFRTSVGSLMRLAKRANFNEFIVCVRALGSFKCWRGRRGRNASRHNFAPPLSGRYSVFARNCSQVQAESKKYTNKFCIE